MYRLKTERPPGALYFVCPLRPSVAPAGVGAPRKRDGAPRRADKQQPRAPRGGRCLRWCLIVAPLCEVSKPVGGPPSVLAG
ncbi:unnamed protein product, partial [Amoebophrya sp. A120]|eukprot:GSA120T00020369001.1